MRSPISFMEETMARTRQENKPEMEVQEENAVCEETVKEEKIEKVKEKKIFTDSDYILCRSVWFGGLNVTCKSGNSYEFSRYGAECEINYRDLVSLIRKGSDHIFLPRFIIEDEDLLDEFPRVRKSYEAMYTVTDLLNILKLSNSRMKAEIAKLPAASKDALSKMIASEIANGHLDSISKVRMLSEIFDSDFNLLSQLFVK